MNDRPSTTSLVDRAYDLLRREILECTLAPGSQVTERSLAAQYELGLSAVRGALVRLTADNLLTAIPRVGYQVAPITLRGIIQFFEAWEILGPPILRLAVTRMSDEHRAEIAAMKVPGPHSGGDEIVAYATRTWAVVVAAADNVLLADLYRRLAGDMQRIFTLVWKSETLSAMQVLGMSTALSATPDEAEKLALAFIRESRARVTEWLLTSTSLASHSVDFQF
ncbi:GntR family transcriptional regulator [Demequina iriomotensis]|uniref:GntR family transcriptional regulator n=1 Tax=Demequina iriomotensis TaxID=1536641 RepID=UPI000781B4FA|nr:GntR family transcriptional regulator [Demequina iriomotensis]